MHSSSQEEYADGRAGSFGSGELLREEEISSAGREFGPRMVFPVSYFDFLTCWEIGGEELLCCCISSPLGLSVLFSESPLAKNVYFLICKVYSSSPSAST